MTGTRVRITVDGRTHEAVIERSGTDLTVRFGDETVQVHGREGAGARAVRVAAGESRHLVERVSLHRVRVDDAVSTFTIDEVASGRAGAEVPTTGLDVRPPMPGRIVRLDVGEGDVVQQGALIAVLEAMKMQNEVTSPAHGVVRRVLVSPGDTVEAHQVILRLGPVEQEPETGEKKEVVA